MFKHRSTLRSPKLAQKKKKLFWVKAVMFFILLLIVLAIPPSLSQIQTFRIHDIKISGNEIVSKDELTEYVWQKISGNYFWIFAKNNILIFPRTSLKQNIFQDFFRIKNIDISIVDKNTINIDIKERDPFAVWCSSHMDADKPVFTNECYFLDERGFVFARSPDFSGNIYMHYYGNISLGNPISQQFLPQNELAQIHSFVEKIRGLGFPVAHVFSYGDGDIEVQTDYGGNILFTTREPIEKPFENLKLLLNDKVSVPEKDDFIKNIDYIDLRFGKKLFFKSR